MTIDRRTITRLRESIQKNSQDIKAVKEKIKVKEARVAIKKGNNEIPVRKAVISPNFSNKTVLTDSKWHYVELFLKRNKESEALNYWYQAENFF
ncbi:hypothetical protein [Paenibacillus daejeonensis]|uniref:hypothetical protein n=1 Tax=Paenibacillus daejeonensis TaxID=135193 RepID=UPI000363089F|nr:hypothetical protein [Paenibacillus daejeonensis]